VERGYIARQSGWEGRVNQDDKGSRGLKIMLQLIVAGKVFFPFFVLLLTFTQAQSAAAGGRSSGIFLRFVLLRPSVKLQEPRSFVTPGLGIPRILVS
jgi:hypothetical protein